MEVPRAGRGDTDLLTATRSALQPLPERATSQVCPRNRCCPRGAAKPVPPFRTYQGKSCVVPVKLLSRRDVATAWLVWSDYKQWRRYAARQSESGTPVLLLCNSQVAVAGYPVGEHGR